MTTSAALQLIGAQPGHINPYGSHESTWDLPTTAQTQPHPAPFHPQRYAVLLNIKHRIRPINIPDPAIFHEAFSRNAVLRMAKERSSLEYTGDRAFYYYLGLILDFLYAPVFGPLSSFVLSYLGHIFTSNLACSTYCHSLGLINLVEDLSPDEKAGANVGLLAGIFELYVGGLFRYDRKHHGDDKRTVNWMISFLSEQHMPHLRLHVAYAVALCKEELTVNIGPCPVYEPDSHFMVFETYCLAPCSGKNEADLWYWMKRECVTEDWRMNSFKVPKDVSFFWRSVAVGMKDLHPVGTTSTTIDNKALGWGAMNAISFPTLLAAYPGLSTITATITAISPPYKPLTRKQRKDSRRAKFAAREEVEAQADQAEIDGDL